MLTLLSVLLASLNFAWSEAPHAPRRGRSNFLGSATYFNSTANYPSGGVVGEYTNVLSEFSYAYDWQPDWRFGGGFRGAWAESTDGQVTRENSGLIDLSVNAQKWFELLGADFAAEGIFAYPAFQPDDLGDEALLSDGAMRLRAGGWLFLPMRTLRPYAYLGFEYRDGGRSYLMPYNVGAKLRMGRFWIQGEWRGFESVSDDVETDNRLDREAYLREVNGGSFRYYAINPSLGEAALEVGARFGAYSVFAGYAMTVYGTNSAEGSSILLGLGYRLDPAARARTRNQEAPEPSFDIQREEYDESLFIDEQEGLTAPPEPKKLAEPPPEPPPAVEMQLELKRVPPKKKPKKKATPNLDKLMKDTEKYLEKK